MSQTLRMVIEVVMTKEREGERRLPRRQYTRGSRVQPERLVKCVCVYMGVCETDEVKWSR